MFWSRGDQLESEAQLRLGSRVRFVGEPREGLPAGASGTMVSEPPARMDVTPFATPPTVPEDEDAIDLTVEVDFDTVGRRWVRIEDLVVVSQR